MAAHIFRVIFDQLAGGDHGIDLGWRDHPAGPAHLAHRVRKEEDPLRCRSPDLIENICLHRTGPPPGSMPETWAKLHVEAARDPPLTPPAFRLHTRGEVLRACAWDLKAAADRLRIPWPSIYDLIKKNPKIRRAGDLSATEIARCFQDCSGDLDAMVVRLVSKRALSRRIKELGLATHHSSGSAPDKKP